MAEIACRQHGVVTRVQLLAAGLTTSAIRRRVAAGRLHPEYRGVYRVGHRAPSVAARYAAAVLAAGEGAALSGGAAAHVQRLRRGAAPAPEVSATRHVRLAGVTTHRLRELPDREVAWFAGIRCTSVARTLVDLAAVLSLEELTDVHHEARIRHQLHPHSVDVILARLPNAPGIANLRAVVHGDSPVLLSRMERRFRRLLREHGFPMPAVNRPAGGHYVDCRWAEHRFTVELDSYRFHGTRKAWEDDRARDRAADARGDVMRRFTWGDVFEDQRYLLAQLERFLPRR